ncbi:BolA family protein [Noviherbaspirillum sp. 1P10PC]|uniref:BolA family protein n=1 Tax=Noviherbaspirillum sp. 1P10PC TaxID=3132292 RepID=UPI0039A13112
MNRIDRMTALLQASLAPLECRIEDDSALHAGHAGAASGGGHYRLRLVSSRFEGQSRIMRHRLVYDALQEMMQQEIHALAITALTPAEAGAAL